MQSQMRGLGIHSYAYVITVMREVQNEGRSKGGCITGGLQATLRFLGDDRAMIVPSLPLSMSVHVSRPTAPYRVPTPPRITPIRAALVKPEIAAGQP